MTLSAPRGKHLTDLDAQLVIRLPSRLRGELERLAREGERSLAAEVRRALRQYLNEEADNAIRG
jgi:predicted transcriptional regulator